MQAGLTVPTCCRSSGYVITYRTVIRTESVRVCGKCIKSVQDETCGLLCICQGNMEKMLCSRCGTDVTSTAECVRCGAAFDVKARGYRAEEHAVPEAAS